jgi:hypothetical protein
MEKRASFQTDPDETRNCSEEALAVQRDFPRARTSLEKVDGAGEKPRKSIPDGTEEKPANF